ncbi:MAG: Holliday junction resolvase RuvX [Clostridia bacterium]|nr:Holliday junction resolvase RuvX [Clostridia bacterium]
MLGKRAIAFDIGNKRIGVAVSDPFNEYAIPCETYFRTRSMQEDVRALLKIAQSKGVSVIVCGLPVNYDGTESIQTIRTQEFINALSASTDLPIETEDERFTTMQARETQIMGGVKRDERKKTVDSIAASYILESYLCRQKERERRAARENEEKGEEENVD